MIKFLTFGAGTQNYVDARNRLVTQASRCNWIDQVRGYGTNDLRSDSEFWGRHGDFIEANPRGYGYWIWKSHLIRKTIRECDQGDCVLYLDAGCEITRGRSGPLYDLVQQSDVEIITSMVHRKYGTEKDWTKMDLIEHLGIDKGFHYLNKPQFQAGATLFRVTENVIALVERWADLCQSNYHLINDDPSVSPNFDGFKEHRHDQSIYSLLLKTSPCKIVTGIDNFVYYCRNRSGATKRRG